MKIKSFVYLAGSVLLLSGGTYVAENVGLLEPIKVFAASSRTVTVEPTNFLNYFQRNGSAANFTYNTSTYTQTLTPNQGSQAGNVTLKNKIDMSQDFSFSGLLNLGDKSKSQGGADGIGILFHPGDTDVVGSTGGAAGIGGVPGAFGFKLDTYYNGWSSNDFTADPSQYSNGQSYGAFVNGLTGQAQTISEGSQAIPQPTNNNFVPFTMNYNGSTKVMTVTYGNQTWSYNVADLVGTNKAMSFSISASTGSFMNLQQLRNVEFTYTVAQGTVTAKYVDESGNIISDSSTTNGDLGTDYNTTQKDIPGYSFKEVTGSPVSGQYTANDQAVTYVYTRNQGNADVKYIDDTDNQVLSTKNLSGNTGDKADYSTAETIQNYENQGYELVKDNYPKDGVTYTDDTQHYEVHLSHKITETTESKTVNETVHYVYQDGTKASDNYKATPVTFTRTVSTDAVTGEKTYGEWSADQTFDVVNSPKIKGYTPNKEQIDKQTVKGDSNDLEFTVTYTKNDPTVTTESKTVNETVHYVYQDGTKASDDYKATPVTFTRTVSTDAVTGEKTYGEWSADQTFDVVNSPKIKGYTPNKEQIDKQTVKGDSNDLEFTVTYTKNDPTVTTESKTVNETVHYVYQDGTKASDDYKATPVTFTRTVSTDAVTGEKTYGEWSADQTFDVVNSPKIKGYTPDKEQIDKQTVKGDSNDLEFTVTYTKNDVPLNPVEPTTPDSQTPQSPTVNVTFNKAGQTPALNKETVGNLPHTGTQVDVTKSLSLSALILGLTTSFLLFLNRKFK
mgnify:FL=1